MGGGEKYDRERNRHERKQDSQSFASRKIVGTGVSANRQRVLHIHESLYYLPLVGLLEPQTHY